MRNECPNFGTQNCGTEEYDGCPIAEECGEEAMKKDEM